MAHLVTEDLNLSISSVDGPAVAAVVAVGVNLDYERHSLHPLLRGEVCAEAVHRDEDLRGKKETELGPEAGTSAFTEDSSTFNWFLGRFWSRRIIRISFINQGIW